MSMKLAIGFLYSSSYFFIVIFTGKSNPHTSFTSEISIVYCPGTLVFVIFISPSFRPFPYTFLDNCVGLLPQNIYNHL